MAKKNSSSQVKYKKVKSTQSFIPIEEIRDGVVITKDKRFVKILEILPSNFMMKSPMEKNDIIDAFQGLLRIAPSNLQFKVIATRANVEEHLRILKREMSTETNEACRRMQEDFYETLKSIGSYEGVTHRFFVAFDFYAGVNNRLPPFPQIVRDLNVNATKIKTMMAAAGNVVIDTANSDEQLREILYSILNRKRKEGSGERINGAVINDGVSDEKQVYNVLARYSKELGIKDIAKLPHIPITDFIAPQSISFDMPNYAVIDGRYYTWLYIPSKGYNPLVYAGWLGSEVNLDEGIDIDIFLHREDAREIKSKLRRLVQSNRILIEDVSEAQQGFEGMKSALESSIYLQDGLRSGEQYYFMNILFTVSASTKEGLKEKIGFLVDELEIQNMSARKLFAQQEQAFISTLPLAKLDSSIYEKSKRNVLTSGAAACYPFLSHEICDPDGLYLGLAKGSGAMVSPDIFNKNKYTNANMFICGRTGAGKTFTLLTLATRARLKHIPIYIVAPVKGEEFVNICQVLGGQYIRFGAGSTSRINVMEIRPRDDAANKILYQEGNDALTESFLASKIQDLLVFFSLLVGDMTLEEKQVLDDILVQVYAKHGITLDNASLMDKNGKWLNKTMPILEEAYNALVQNPITKKIGNITKQLVYGSASSFNGQTNVSLDNPLTVLDLTLLGKNEDLMAPGMFMAIDFVMAKAKEDSTKKKLVMFDEWWKFTLSEYAAKYSMEIARVIRAYGGGAIYATQQLSDASGNGNYGKAVLNACKTKIILGLEVDEAEYVQKALKLTDEETHEIIRNPTGTALLISNSDNLTIQIKVSQKEQDLFSTDRETKARIVKERKREMERAGKGIGSDNEIDNIKFDIVE